MKKGRSRKTISANIQETMRSYQRTGAIGSSHPTTAQKAQKMAAAMSYRMAGKSRKRG